MNSNPTVLDFFRGKEFHPMNGSHVFILLVCGRLSPRQSSLSQKVNIMFFVVVDVVFLVIKVCIVVQVGHQYGSSST